MVQFRPNAKRPVEQRFRIGYATGPQNSAKTSLTLRMYDFRNADDPSLDTLIDLYEQIEERPTPDLIASFAEVAHLEGRKREAKDTALAAELYASSSLACYRFLFDPEYIHLQNPFDEQFRDIYLLYNGSLERLLRLLLNNEQEFRLIPGEELRIASGEHQWRAECRMATGSWKPEEIDYFKFAWDYELVGVENEYRQGGLGVPLIARRKQNPTGRHEEKYYPLGLCFPVTAFLRPLDRNLQEADGPDAILELYDPLVATSAMVNGIPIPLESDLTTPLAFFLTSPQNQLASSVGLFRPEELLKPIPGLDAENTRTFKGLYMMQPYEPGKIPVVMIHGLWSSPLTWMEMFNSLRSYDEIREHYQFWFYFYPSGQPFWVSAAELRDDLTEIRATLDPEHKQRKLDEMVLIGHSMGGLIAEMQTMDSGTHFWNLISDHSFDEVELDPEIKAELQDWFFFQANPSVRRVITIATPFEGSDSANDITKWFANRLIAMPSQFSQVVTSFLDSQSRLIKDDRMLKIRTSVASLAPECPVYKAMDSSHLADNVTRDNIVGVLPELESRWYSPVKSDGVVEWKSSHRQNASSETIIPAPHMTVHTHPAAIFQTLCLLKDHLNKMNRECVADEVPIAPRTAQNGAAVPREATTTTVK
ncbi:MAG: alpha/beta hydrolase [Planctomycetia bacterium]|nr:alpha/beta hydrolase [Planctomycetia bacterium]